MRIFSRRKYINTEQFQSIANALSISFASLREEYVLGSLMQLKKEGIDVSLLSRDVSPGSELEDILKGFQLTSMIGVAWYYIKEQNDQLYFDKMLSSHLGAQPGSRARRYRERYIECQGQMEKLCSALSSDVHRAFGDPEPRQDFILQFQGGAIILIGLCQEATCKACGDDKKAQKLRKQALSYLC